MRSRLLALPLLAALTLSAVIGCAPAQAAPVKAAKSITCTVKGVAPSAEGNKAAKDFCRVEKSVANELAASIRKDLTKKQIAKIIPAGTQLTVLSQTWKKDVFGTGTVLIAFKQKGKEAQPYLAFLVKQGTSGWKLLGTVKVTVDK